MGKAFALALGLAAAPLAPLAAQADQAPASQPLDVDAAIAKEHEVYGVPKPDPAPVENCASADADSTDIVVCARKPSDNSRFRVQSTAELDPKSRQNLYDGLPRAPDLGPPPCSGGCIKFGSPPPPAVMIDLKAIPEPPPGSDADRIAKGEKAAP
jgi:hypothetical protein